MILRRPATRRRVRAAGSAWVIALGVIGAASPPAQAQSIVQKCRIDGQWVLQNGPCPLEARPLMRTAAATSPAPAAVLESGAAPHKKTLAELLRDRDGGDPPRTREASRDDGAMVLRDRMGAV